MVTHDLRGILIEELQKLVTGRSNIDRATEVVRLANSVNELLRTETNIKKVQLQFEKEGKNFVLGDVEISK